MGQVIVLGLIAGGIYGLFAVGVVLIYRGSGVLNFAQGELGTLGLYAAWWLSTEHELPWVVGALGALVVAGGLGLLFELAIVRHMVEASRVSVSVATVGLLLFLIAIEFRFFGASPRQVPPPIHGIGHRIAGVFVSPTQWLSLVVAVVIGAGLAAILRRTDFGLGVLAAAQDPVAVRLVGVPLARVSSFVWGAGAAVSALGALFIVPTVGYVTPGYASALFLSGLVAAVVGGLDNLPGAFAGGVAVGIIEVGARRVLETPSFPGVSFLALFVVIIAVLVLRPQGLLSGIRLPLPRRAS